MFLRDFCALRLATRFILRVGFFSPARPCWASALGRSSRCPISMRFLIARAVPALPPSSPSYPHFQCWVWNRHSHYVTAALRSFANDAVGHADDFRGWGNYLEAPLTYCGIICLLPRSSGICREPAGANVWSLGLFFGGVLVPTVFPWFRYLFWAFQGDYYRTYSLFCVMGVITLSADHSLALSRTSIFKSLAPFRATILCTCSGSLFPNPSTAERHKPGLGHVRGDILIFLWACSLPVSL